MSYDYIIVGAGPVGLTLAWLFSHRHQNKKIVVIDREDDIGGCHRVRRYQGLFTEHGPRIYSNIYLNMTQILGDMGIPFDQIFTPYNFSSGSISSDILTKLSIREITLLGIEYFKLIFNPIYGQTTAVADFLQAHNFSAESRDLLNRVCRLTDGAGIDRYTMFELLSGFDQHVFYSFMQPRQPNDRGLFAIWRTKLKSIGVDFMLNTTVNKVNYDHTHPGHVLGVNIQSGNGSHDLLAPNVILALPPNPVAKILRGLTWNGIDLTRFGQASQYAINIPIVFHWNKKLILPKVWGFPSTDWGVVSILLSDYTHFDEPQSQTVITTCITLTDTPSSKTRKTANQTADKNTLIDEVFRQLSDVYGGLPTPTAAILSPEMYRGGDEKWQSTDTAFVLTPAGGFIREQRNKEIKGLYWVGTHNGNSYYHFTSMESAVTNALAFYIKYGGNGGGMYQLHKPLNLSKILRYVIAVIVVLFGIWIYHGRIATNFS